MKLSKKTISLISFGTFIVLTSPVLAKAETKDNQANTNGRVDFMYGSEDANPLDPINENPEEITPTNPGDKSGTKGNLRIDLAPNLIFKDITVSGYDEISYAKAMEYKVIATNEKRFTPNFLQVTDIRGDKFGWKVSAQAGPLVKYNKDNEGNLRTAIPNSEIKNAAITFKKPTILSKSGINPEIETALTPTAKQTVLPLENSSVGDVMLDSTRTTEEPSKGYGIWVALYGEEKEDYLPAETINEYQNENISLYIPAKAHKSAGAYKADIIWTIEETP